MASGKTLQSTIEISGVLSPSLQKAINSAVDRLSEMAEETLETADAATRLAAEMNAQEDILKNLKRAYAGYAASGKENSEQARELKKRIENVSEELEDNRDTLKAAEKAVDSLADAQEDAGESAERSSEGYTVLKDVISDLAADAIEKAVEAFKELAIEGDKALAMLEARTGATGSELEGLGDVMDEVYNAGYGESLGDVQETLSTVLSMTDDLDKASLAQITKNSIALSDVFGFDTMESLRAVNSLMDQFGITSDEAYNLIVQGAQNGLNQNDDLLDTINEYSVQFKNAGYSADDMFNMLTNGVESGTWSVDKLGDAVKEFNIRMSDGTANDYLADLGVDVDEVMEKFNNGGADAQEAIGTVMDALLECDDATLQYQTGVGLFGTMWEDLGADAVAALMSTEGAIDRTANAMEQMDGAAYDTLENSLSVLGRTIKAEVVKPIAEKLFPVIKKSVDYVTDKVGPAVDWITDHLPEIGVALGTVGSIIAAMKWGSITSGIGKAVSSIKGVFTALTSIPPPVLAVIAIVAALAAGFVYLWKTNEEFREKMTALWGELQGTFAELGSTIGNTLAKLAPIISQLFTAVIQVAAQIVEAVLPVLLQLIDAVLSVLIELLNQLLPIIVQVVTTVLPVLLEIINQLIPVLMQIVTTVLTALMGIIQQLLPVIIQIIQTVLPILLQLINAILPVVMQIVMAVLPILMDIINALLPILTAVLGLLTPILNLVMALVTPLLNLVMSVLNPLLNVLMTLISAVLPIVLQLINAILPAVLQIVMAVLPILMAVLNVLTPILDLIVALLTPILNLIIALVTPILNLVTGALTIWINILATLISLYLKPIIFIIEAVANVITAVLGVAIKAVQPIIQGLTNVFQGLISFISGTFSSLWNKAWSGIVNKFSGLWSGLVGMAKGPINSVISLVNRAIGALNKVNVKIPDWVPGMGGKSYGVNIPKIPMLAAGGFTDGVSIAGEAGTEAVISFDPAYRSKNLGIWEQAGQMLGVLSNEEHGAGLTGKAGELLTLDDFSLGSLADGTSISIYYDFSGFTWSPQIQKSGNGEDEDTFMAQLRAHEAEFFDWLEEFIQMREVAQYA